ncbi:hypothetical protein F2Q69_00019454 [Brassica cretica]|uniref:Uncharacterized protein n=1 Tax=Brassica cretica TaxID=69181 RepID=A0A8S9QLF2_BRACR|nr:hypothetical protein F2Q69_00019454 [Brassica cretica]
MHRDRSQSPRAFEDRAHNLSKKEPHKSSLGSPVSRKQSDAVIRSVVDLVETQKEALLSSQPLSDDGDSTGASTNMFCLQINEMVEKAVPKRKGGRLLGLARCASSYPSSSSSQVPYTDPMILEQLQNKDERIVALEKQNTTILSENATILAQLESQKKTNAEILEKLDHLDLEQGTRERAKIRSPPPPPPYSTGEEEGERREITERGRERRRERWRRGERELDGYGFWSPGILCRASLPFLNETKEGAAALFIEKGERNPRFLSNRP